MSEEERKALKEAKSTWRSEMKEFFGLQWTKKGANKRDEHGRSMMNIPIL